MSLQDKVICIKQRGFFPTAVTLGGDHQQELVDISEAESPAVGYFVLLIQLRWNNFFSVLLQSLLVILILNVVNILCSSQYLLVHTLQLLCFVYMAAEKNDVSHLCYFVAYLGLFLHYCLEVTGLGLIPSISEFRSRRMSLKRNMIIFFFLA